MKRTAFMTIEVLISLVIISMGVVTVTSALKTFYAAAHKQDHYEEALTTLYSLNDMINKIDFEKQKQIEGVLNGWKYSIKAEQINIRRTYVSNDLVELSGNIGRYNVILYKVIMTISNNGLTKTYTLYRTRTKMLPGMNNVF